MELQAITGQLYIVHGEVQEGVEIPGLLAQSPPSRAARGRTRDSLFVHLSLSGNLEETKSLAQDLLEAISNRYYRTAGSVTAALRAAIMEANQLLLRMNMSGQGRPREGALVCVVLREQELFMVQTGEAFALIGRNFGVERLPGQPPDRVTPLGRAAGLDLRYFHNWLEPGDMLLLTDPRLPDLPGEELRRLLVNSTAEDSVAELAEIVGDETGRLLLVEFSDEAPADLPETVRIAPAAAATRRPSAGQTLSPPTRPPHRHDTNAPPAEREAGARRPAVPVPEIDLPSASDVEYSARRATSQTARGLSRFSGWLAELMNRLRPQRDEQAEDEPQPLAMPLLLVLLIPILVALVITGVYFQRGRISRVGEIRQEMQQALAAATDAPSEEEARASYEEVLTLAGEAELLRPGDSVVQRLRGQALDELDRIDDITRLSTQLLYRYGEGSEMTGILLRDGFNGDIYTLDSGNNRAYVHDTEEDYVTMDSEEPEQILFGGQAVGSHVVGRLLDLIWRSRGTQVSNDGVAFLDANGALISYYPSFSNVRAVPLGLASDWVQPNALTQFNERIYVLDPGASQIWRYFPEGDGFIVDESQRALSLPDMNQAVDVAIYSEDGSVIVLYGDGRLRRYGQDSLLWDEASLYESGLQSPLEAPTRLKIIGRGLNSSIFVADPGSARIIQLSLGGTFLAQYKATDQETGEELFGQLGDFDVADAPLRLFVAAGDGLYVAEQD